ncbi:endo-alpha-N-acetylgalactosaminidase family protein [Clostridium tertium]|uniref:endo-alpha-N-acetylgalactosaminidase family protein n=1 Tax=Clostridium tertium TaxID=1559 RepID=UPI00232DA12B|nr:endo-alpha-N-acetylgalactosaminidase family protein [Clostridium tertium]MDB1924025.1 endo-alpha-N-acetylgalactosaminidase family protein [Clostridium tertium]MDB1927110.1 endo-alpha-N-acetylgalactosaminidase family protein [Clostridium tertium]MDB1930260.1 endo-alpha-N-acetylgalactosaminidase family protein [Clostridium tertium]
MVNILKGSKKRLGAGVIAIAVFCTCIFPSLHVLAAPKTMAHIKAGSGNGNGHFGSANPELFVLSDKKDIRDESISFQMKVGSEKNDTRFRFVTKYVDDNHWGYVAYDGATGWFIEYKNGNKGGYPGITGLPGLNQNDIVNISAVYVENGLKLKVENEISGESGEVLINTADFISLKNEAGKIGFGAAAYGTAYTDIYFSDVTVGSDKYTNYNAWTLYKDNLAGQVWEPSVVVTDKEDPEEPSEQGEKWFKLTGGSNNGGGHAYGNPAAAAPVLLLNNSRKMEEAGELSLKLKPSNNWGVFYSYVDDNNWLYIGHDSSSKWYYQYKLNGSESYPKISGLPEPVEGQELQMSVSLNRETLSVTVNGTTVRVTNQALISFAEKTSGKGRFGVKTNGATSISFADMKYNDTNTMEDKWGFAAERQGQKVEEEYSKLVPVSGIVLNKDGNPIPEAVIRIGANSANSDVNGRYQFDGLEIGEHNMAVTKPGYEAYSKVINIEDKNNVIDIILEEKAGLDLTQYDSIASETMKVYIGKTFPVVARYQILKDGGEVKDQYFRGNETKLNTVAINGIKIEPTVTVAEEGKDFRVYSMHVENTENNINLDMKIKVSVEGNNLTWEVIELNKAEGSAKIATIDVPQLNLLTVDAVEEGANFAGAQTSTTTTSSGDVFIDFENGFVPSKTDSYLYGFLTNSKLSAGLFSNSEAEGDKRVVRNNGADTMSLTSAPWYYELGDKNGQKAAAKYEEYPVSDLPCTKVAIAADKNGDGDIDWNDGALAFRDIMNIPYGSEVIKDMVNYRIVMNFASMASNPYLTTADNIKKVYLATDGLPQSVMLKGYGNEGHDSANSEYADIAEREGGVEDFQDLIKIAHDYNTEIGVHVNAQEIYPEAASFNEDMLQKPIGNGWGWLDQSHVIDKLWDLSTQARWKRFVQLYDRINGTSFYNREWPDAVEDSKGEVTASKEAIKADAESRKDNMDFIYLDVWYQDAWETRNIAKEINSLGWRFTTEFSAQGEYDSTWQHWSTDAVYGGATSKGFNSDIIRFIRNDHRDSQVLNYPAFGGTADNPLLGGYRLYGFEGWGGDKDYNNYILQTFNQNLPTKFLQHYVVTDWENYEKGQSPVGNHEKEIKLRNDAGDEVVVTRNEEQRSDDNIERTITLNGKVVLNDVTYLLPWTEENGTEKLYHWNLDGGKTTWELPKGWEGLGNVVMYELSDQGRINEISVPVTNGSVTLEAKAATAYVLAKGSEIKELKNDFGETDYVVDPGFNGYAAGEKLSSDKWSGDIEDESVVIEKANTGDQRLAFNSPSEDVSVTTTISGLKKNTNYVAEVYVENNSDEKATIEVNTGKETVSNYTERSILMNYVKSDQKNGSKMQRMQISFTAKNDTAELTLSREAGEGSTYMDDIRIVEKTLNNFQEDGTFKQDFETVVQGLYPFVLSSAQGISDPGTHLSQLNEPYTQAGWNGRVIDDVISGEWSVKHHSKNTGIIYQTLPQNFRFEPGKVYNVEFDYQSGPDKAYAMVIGDGTNYTAPSEEQYLAEARGETKHVKMQVIGNGSGQTWIGLYQNASKSGSGAMGQTDFTLDNLVITEDKDAVAVTLSSTNLYKGETATIYGSGLDKIKWNSSDEKVAVVDKDANVVKALSAGHSTITATLPDGKEVVFEMNIIDDVVIDIPREEFSGISSSANTEQVSGEPAGSGVASAAADGNSSTYWHSNWSGGVSKENPAILTVDLGKEMKIGGFKFQQRPSANNGIVQQFKYEVLDSEGNVLETSDSITALVSEMQGGAWVTAKFKETRNAKAIKIYVEKGQGNFAAISEVAPIILHKVADTVSLEDVTMNIGGKVTLIPKHAENTVLKGIVWSSSDEKIVKVNQNGLLTAVNSGTAKVKITNAAGLMAEATVTVEKKKLDYTELEKTIKNSEKLDLSKYQDGAEKDEFVAALEYAKALLDNAASQDEIDNAVKALTEAQSALKLLDVEDVDRSELGNVIAEYEKIDLDKYKDGAEKDAFINALKAAKDAYDKASTQIEVDNALSELKTAKGNLIELPGEENVDRSELGIVIAEYEKIDLDKYKDGAEKDAFINALKAAKDAYDKASTQIEIDNALSALKTAKGNLVEVETEEPGASKVDKSKLEKFYKEILEYYKETNHSKENWKKYQDALKIADKVINDKDATQEEVDNALNSLINITKLMNKELGNPSDVPELPETGSRVSSTIVLVLAIGIVAIGGAMFFRKRRHA